jgi:hypothetical protein
VTDLAAAPPPKSASPLRWILLGCGALTLLVAFATAGLGGIFYLIYKGTDDTAKIGADYLRSSARLHQVFGADGFSVERKWFGWNVQVVNDGGQARFEYRLLNSQKGPKGAATVWLIRKAGAWSPVGAQCRPEEAESFSIGDPPKGATVIVDY